MGMVWPTMYMSTHNVNDSTRGLDASVLDRLEMYTSRYCDAQLPSERWRGNALIAARSATAFVRMADIIAMGVIFSVAARRSGTNRR